MNLISKIEIEENGNVYIEETYSNGTKNKYLKPSLSEEDTVYVPQQTQDYEERIAELEKQNAELQASLEMQAEVLDFLIMQ